MYNSRTRSNAFAPLRCPKCLNISPPPISCAENKNMPLFVCHLLAVYDFHFRSIPFQELSSFLTLTPDAALHFHSNHTLQHRTASVVSFLSIPQAPFMQSVITQAIFPRYSSGLFFISAASLPH